MFAAKSTLLFAVFAISTRLASAAPPACLLAAVNTQSHPADLPTLCGKDSSEVQEQIKNLCGSNVEAALDAYRSTCKKIGKTIPSESSSSKPSKTNPATSKSTNKSKAESTGESSTESTGESTTTTKASSFTFAASTPYPITYTSTYFDNECSCTKTSTVSSTAVVGTSGFVSATGSASSIGFAAPSESLGSGPGSYATGSPILPSGTNPVGSSATPSPYTGAAAKNLGAFGAGIFAIAGLVLAL